MQFKPLLPPILCALLSSAAYARPPLAHEDCSIEPKQPAQRVFAQTDDKQPWKEYKRVEDVPELSLDFGTLAQTWMTQSGALLVRTEEPGEDLNSYTDYCFDKEKHLIHLGYELRTAWGWGFRMEGLVTAGEIHANSRQFFNTATGKPIQRPRGADDVRKALKPSLFLSVDRLPFSRLLSK